MQRDPPTLDQLVQLALDCATRAGAFILAGYRSRPAYEKKQRFDLVTEFDLKSEARIRAELRAATPDIPILAEEGGGHAGAELTWHVDPLDGTTNFAHGHPFWAVSVGLMRGGTAVLGAVVAPALGLSWHGQDNGPSFRDGKRCSVSGTRELGEALVATGFPTDRRTAPSNNFAAFERVKARVQGVRRCGAAAIDLCMVADGTYDGYWERQLSSWDLAAGAAVLLGAGGQLSALDGSAPRLEHGHVVASNGLIHDALLQLAADPDPPRTEE